jgi:hypothetical protein
MKRRYSSVGPAVSHRRLLVKDFDCIRVVAEEVLQLAGAPDKKREHWILFEMKVDEVSPILFVFCLYSFTTCTTVILVLCTCSCTVSQWYYTHYASMHTMSLQCTPVLKIILRPLDPFYVCFCSLDESYRYTRRNGCAIRRW